MIIVCLFNSRLGPKAGNVKFQSCNVLTVSQESRVHRPGTVGWDGGKHRKQGIANLNPGY